MRARGLPRGKHATGSAAGRWVLLALAILVVLGAVALPGWPGTNAPGQSTAAGPASLASPTASASVGSSGPDRQPRASPAGPNVLLVTIDSLRADHLGSAGYWRARTPNLDRLAAEGVRFARHYTTRNGTTPAHASIFTGSYASTHGIRSHMFDLLAPGVPTIAELFAERDYVTAGLYSWLAFEPRYSGLERGFRDYVDLTVSLPRYEWSLNAEAPMTIEERLATVLVPPGAIDDQVAYAADSEEVLDGKADVTTDAAILWLRDHVVGQTGGGRPFFLWVHYWDPHYPFTPPPPFDRVEPDGCADCPDGSLRTIRAIQSGERLSPAQSERLQRYYDAEIAFVDAELGRLFVELDRLGLGGDTLIVVTADHGESFGELGTWLHGHDMYEPEVRVPLLVRFPGRAPAGETVEAVTSSVDVMPTILELVGLPIPSTVDGQSLLSLVRDESSGDDRHAFAELADRLIVTVITRDWQLLKNNVSGALRLYRTAEAPWPEWDWVYAEPEVAARLERLLDRWQQAHP